MNTAESLDDLFNALTRTRTQVFNTLSQLSEQIGSAGTAAVTTNFGYDTNGNQISINAPLARNTANQYDALNRLKQITDPNNGITRVQLRFERQPLHRRRPAQPHHRLHLRRVRGPDPADQPGYRDHGDSYDSGGNLATSTDARNQTGTYSYDAHNGVTQIAYADQTLTFGYDTGANGIGHLTSAGDTNHSLAWTYDALGRVNR